MLPEFPRAFEAIQKVWNRILFDAAGFSDPLVSQIAVRVQHEGNRAFHGDAETEYKAESVSHEWKPEVGKGIGTEEFFSIPDKIGKELAAKQAKGVFEAMSEPSPKSGSVNISEGPLNFDLWLTKMEPFEVDFGENGLPKWPQWFVSENAMAAFQESVNQGLTADQSKRLEELVARKREEFNERENRRRLVE